MIDGSLWAGFVWGDGAGGLRTLRHGDMGGGLGTWRSWVRSCLEEERHRGLILPWDRGREIEGSRTGWQGAWTGWKMEDDFSPGESVVDPRETVWKVSC